jgi:hypothetical protein
MTLPAHYDEWRLRGHDEPHQIGMEEGDECGRYPEPDEDMPRGYRPNPCRGEMVRTCSFDDRLVACDTCGEVATCA